VRENSEKKERVAVEGRMIENEKKFRNLGFLKTVKSQPDPILGRPPSRPGLTENNFGYSRSTSQSTDFRPNLFGSIGLVLSRTQNFLFSIFNLA